MTNSIRNPQSAIRNLIAVLTVLTVPTVLQAQGTLVIRGATVHTNAARVSRT